MGNFMSAVQFLNRVSTKYQKSVFLVIYLCIYLIYSRVCILVFVQQCLCTQEMLLIFLISYQKSSFMFINQKFLKRQSLYKPSDIVLVVAYQCTKQTCFGGEVRGSGQKMAQIRGKLYHYFLSFFHFHLYHVSQKSCSAVSIQVALRSSTREGSFGFL